MIDCRVVQEPRAIAALAPAWNELYAQSRARHAFQSYAWFDCWAAVFGSDKQIRVFAFFEGERLVGVAPTIVVATRRGPKLRIGYDLTPDDLPFVGIKGRYRVLPVRQMSFPCSLESSNVRGEMLCAGGYRERCEDALARQWAMTPGWDLAVLCLAPAAAQSLARSAQRHGLPALLRPAHRQFGGIEMAPWDAYLDSKPRQFRKNMRRAAMAGAGLECRVVEGREPAGPALETMYAIAARSWKCQGRAKERDLLPLTERTRRFYRRLCASPGADLVPAIALLYRDAAPVAAMLVLMTGERLLGCVTYYDPAVAALSPGRHLLRALYGWSIARGARYFDLNGESPFTQYFANHAEGHDQVLLFNRTAYGRALHRLGGFFQRTEAVHGDPASLPGH